MAEVIGALGVHPRFVESESTEMSSVVLAKTASRQVLGVMNEFTFMFVRPTPRPSVLTPSTKPRPTADGRSVSANGVQRLIAQPTV